MCVYIITINQDYHFKIKCVQPELTHTTIMTRGTCTVLFILVNGADGVIIDEVQLDTWPHQLTDVVDAVHDHHRPMRK